MPFNYPWYLLNIASSATVDRVGRGVRELCSTARETKRLCDESK
jgi:hypothetical protein